MVLNPAPFWTMTVAAIKQSPMVIINCFIVGRLEIAS
jgi:hypothetical protein